MNWIDRKKIIPPAHHHVLICNMEEECMGEYSIAIAYIDDNGKAIFEHQYTYNVGVWASTDRYTHWIALYDIPKPNQPERLNGKTSDKEDAKV